MPLLRYRAGARARQHLRSRGLTVGDVCGFVLPATGPRWLVAAGFDRALIEAGLLGARSPGAQRTLLMCASAGSWRALALAGRDPLRAQQALVESYCGQRFRRSDSAERVSAAYRELLASVARDEDVLHALDHPVLDLAVSVVRARGPRAQRLRGELPARQRMMLNLAGAAALNLVRPQATQWFFERVVFHTRHAQREQHRLLAQFAGRRARLSALNLRDAALASGTVPLYMEPVRDLEGPGSGAYLDGGLADYHFNQRLRTEDGILLMFSHQARVVPGWFDKGLPWRGLTEGAEDLLVVYPDPEFIAQLPGGRVPNRDDFWTFEDAPSERIRRWREAADRSEALGRAFLDDLARGGIAEKVEALEPQAD